MELPLQITFRGVSPSESIKAAIRERALKLDRFYDRIMRCRVVVDSPHRHQRKGKIYHVRIDLTVPGGELVVKQAPADHAPHEDIYLAIHDAFDEARRQLDDHVRRRRRQVKTRVGPPRARVRQLFKERDFGFLETSDGREVYFHRNSVLNGAFDRLEIGTEVRFAEGEGEKGPQASTVEVVGKG